MLTLPTVLNGLVSLTANPATLSPFQTSLPVKMPINFGSVANLQVLTGSYTPVNNTQTVATGLSGLSPNFLLFICDGLVNLSTDNGFLTLVPIIKCFFQTLSPIVGGANPINTFTLSGLSANPYPMVQNTTVNYTLVYGQAQIT